ncbi:MAG: glycosyltransferase [Pirellula sp.]|jgi:glycosyltransferase involved in cell wall biosynthesis|nr:glycosyltransferase [Pirellula sp.]
MQEKANLSRNYLLTIGIPTYCRADLLDLCLASVLPQVQELADRVECVVSDNASTDHTAEVLEKYQSQFACLKTFRNDSNIGIIGNITKTASELATGQYVLLIGDDDVLTSGAVSRILYEIQSEAKPDLIALNVGYLPRGLRPKPHESLGGVTVHCEKKLRSSTTRRGISLSEAFEGPPADFTASYSVVIKRSNWLQVFPGACSETPFSSVKTTYPSGFVIAETIHSGMVTVLGEPSVIIYEMPGNEFSWARYRGVTSTRYATELLDKFECGGVSAKRLLPYKHYQLEHRNEELGELLWDKTTAGGWKDAMVFAWHLKQFPIRLAKCFVLSLLHKQAPWWLSWIPRLALRAKKRL